MKIYGESMILKRFEHTDLATRGVLILDNKAIALTLENPWRNNAKNISCIPFGMYTCKRIISPKFKKTFEVTGVHNRTHIVFHNGNTEKDTEGCILLGSTIGDLYEGDVRVPAVLKSRETRARFMEITAGLNSFILNIVNV